MKKITHKNGKEICEVFHPQHPSEKCVIIEVLTGFKHEYSNELFTDFNVCKSDAMYSLNVIYSEYVEMVDSMRDTCNGFDW